MVHELTPKKREKRSWEDQFLKELEKSGNVTAACRKARISRTEVYQLRNEAKDFADAWVEALESATDDLELEARRRAHRGTLKPVFYEGKKVGTVKEYSDTLLIFLLKAHRPERFNIQRFEHSGPAGKPIEIKGSVTAKLDRLTSILNQARQRQDAAANENDNSD